MPAWRRLWRQVRAPAAAGRGLALRHRTRTTRLLHDVRSLVGHQAEVVGRLARAERDVAALGEGLGAHAVRGRPSGRVVVHAYAAEVGAEAALEPALGLGRQRSADAGPGYVDRARSRRVDGLGLRGRLVVSVSAW